MHKENSYLISICMMVKNEESNLSRCLQSITPLLDRSDVELIIVDTGSIDNTIEIANKYTKKIFYRKWQDNFSEIRNYSISAANGKWVFIIDADEEFIELDKIIKLLNSNDIDNYNAIQLLTNNILYKDGSKTIITPSCRIFKNGNLSYDGAIHNQPIFNGPVYNTNIYFNHYGYINDDRELMDNKFNRTATILKREILKDPNNVYYQYQLAKSLGMHGDHIEALQQIRTAYKVMKENKQIKLYIYLTYANLALLNKCYNEAVEISEEGLQFNDQYIDLFFILSKGLYNIKMYHEAIHAYRRYLKLYEIGENLSIFDDASLEVIYFEENYKLNVIKELIMTAIEINEFKIANEYIHLVNNTKAKNKLAIELYLKSEDYTALKEYLIVHFHETEYPTEIENLVEEVLNNKDDKVIRDISAIFADEETSYGMLNNIRSMDDERVQSILIKEFFQSYDITTLGKNYYVIFEIAISVNFPILKELKKASSRYIKHLVLYSFEKSTDLSSYFYDYMYSTSNIRTSDFQTNRVYCAISNPILLHEQEKANKEENKQLKDERLFEAFNQYIASGENYINLLYQVDRLRINYSVVDDMEHQLFILLYLSAQSAKKGDVKTTISYYKKAVDVYKPFAKYLEIYLGKLYQDIAKGLIEKNMYEEAMEMYEEALIKSESDEEQDDILNKITSLEGSQQP
ncbi:glycosyltransferase family 2 protein [Gracilibacillus massiliensis]|uniref:glycosyltransferase family 2 protein n=1 Tax=Gracilibacillus massiliensis TaxID=1564956 RepID=UPI00071D979C|nr:glycosyltransferase family 2 protein [Gracilibacillus massiliensis]